MRGGGVPRLGAGLQLRPLLPQPDGTVVGAMALHSYVPKGPDKLEFVNYIFAEKDTPPALKARMLRLSIQMLGTSGLVEQDDARLIEAYAWACMTAEKTLVPRDNLNAPTAEEISAGHALTERDYAFERATTGAAEQDRDGIAKYPRFTKKLSDDAKLRVAALSKEAKEYQRANMPK